MIMCRSRWATEDVYDNNNVYISDKMSKLRTPANDLVIETQYKEDCEKITKAVAPLEQVQVGNNTLLD